ncbi:hypothetical protein NKR23_g8981 [Pleurostoma richardsiae]|uniref:Aminoglycoside phosphotransferase domain-containing protein n=1 Tax=Pleurostoma richardsiae TaxID=41990 RepID=A0AA38RH70_9PEZI|nr:hypothetical protein NKR23_g8981 [Pleurostoma richardsiae]
MGAFISSAKPGTTVPELERETEPAGAAAADSPATLEPEGTVIFESLGRKIVRHGDRVTKIDPDGIKPSEAEVMRFIGEHTEIPVPRVHDATLTSITMDFVEGTTLEKTWNSLSDAERDTVSAQLRGYLDQLRAIKGSYIGGFGRNPAVVSRYFSVEGGPFASEAEWNDFLLEDIHPEHPRAFRSMVQDELRTDHDIVLTHGDLVAQNILVRDGRIVALLDWENAGFYPEYVELVKPLRGPDWRVGYYNALLDIFPRRYGAEYLMDQFLSSISRH